MKSLKLYISSLFRPLRNWRRQRFFLRKYGEPSKNVTILSNNCLAGIIYHDANKPFFSPTINLTIVNDFLYFAKYFDFYKKAKLEKIENPIECPRAFLRGNDVLPTIQVKFTHYKTFDEAKNKWESRCLRFNSSCPLYIIYTADAITKEEAKLLSSIKSTKTICIFKTNNFDVKSFPNVHFVRVPFEFFNKDITSYKHLTSRKRYFDDFIDLYSLIYNSDSKK